MRRLFDIELVITALVLFFAIVISSYHLSYDGFLGLSERAWALVWAVSENGMMILLSSFLALMTTVPSKNIFKFVLIPYFAVKIIYHISCYSGVVFMSEQGWSRLWSIILVALLIITIFVCRTLLKKK